MVLKLDQLVYTLAGLNRGDRLSNEASLKYFLLGSLASCILIYGVALLYVSLSITGVYETSIAISFIGSDNASYQLDRHVIDNCWIVI